MSQLVGALICGAVQLHRSIPGHGQHMAARECEESERICKSCNDHRPHHCSPFTGCTQPVFVKLPVSYQAGHLQTARGFAESTSHQPGCQIAGVRRQDRLDKANRWQAATTYNIIRPHIMHISVLSDDKFTRSPLLEKDQEILSLQLGQESTAMQPKHIEPQDLLQPLLPVSRLPTRETTPHPTDSLQLCAHIYSLRRTFVFKPAVNCNWPLKSQSIAWRFYAVSPHCSKHM